VPDFRSKLRFFGSVLVGRVNKLWRNFGLGTSSFAGLAFFIFLTLAITHEPKAPMLEMMPTTITPHEITPGSAMPMLSLQPKTPDQTTKRDDRETSLKIDAGGNATIIGIVLDNNHGCTIDLRCYLKLQVGDQEVKVIYNPGEGEHFCFNNKAAQRGFNVKEGQKVRVYGKYKKIGNRQFLTTCPSKAYYIKNLHQTC